MNGKQVIASIKRKLRITKDVELAKRLGVTVPAIQLWKRRKTVTPLQIANLIASSKKISKEETQTSSLRPIVEFFQIEKHRSERAKKWALFAVKADRNAKAHPYLSGLKSELEASHGVYIFFDSRGRAIYAGKARKQSLWRELAAAFNRDRGEVQKIKRVNHPQNRVRYRKSDEKARQISEHIVPLHELARYVSAYYVDDGMIDRLEALLVRSFANDLLNVRMEKFRRKV